MIVSDLPITEGWSREVEHTAAVAVVVAAAAVEVQQQS